MEERSLESQLAARFIDIQNVEQTFKTHLGSFTGAAGTPFAQFVANTSNGCADHTQEMGYYDGNTVTGLWNYAQFFAMSDNSYGSPLGSIARSSRANSSAVRQVPR